MKLTSLIVTNLIFGLSKLSHGYSQEKPLEAIWPGDKYVEESFDPMKLFLVG